MSSTRIISAAIDKATPRRLEDTLFWALVTQASSQSSAFLKLIGDTTYLYKYYGGAHPAHKAGMMGQFAYFQAEWDKMPTDRKNFSIEDEAGRTPLTYAAAANHKEIIALYLKNHLIDLADMTQLSLAGKLAVAAYYRGLSHFYFSQKEFIPSRKKFEKSEEYYLAAILELKKLSDAEQEVISLESSLAMLYYEYSSFRYFNIKLDTSGDKQKLDEFICVFDEMNSYLSKPAVLYAPHNNNFMLSECNKKLIDCYNGQAVFYSCASQYYEKQAEKGSSLIALEKSIELMNKALEILEKNKLDPTKKKVCKDNLKKLLKHLKEIKGEPLLADTFPDALDVDENYFDRPATSQVAPIKTKKKTKKVIKKASFDRTKKAVVVTVGQAILSNTLPTIDDQEELVVVESKQAPAPSDADIVQVEQDDLSSLPQVASDIPPEEDTFRKIEIPDRVLKPMWAIEQQGYKVKLYGGAVIDTWLGLAPTDFDLRTNAPIEFCQSLGFHQCRYMLNLLQRNAEVKIDLFHVDSEESLSDIKDCDEALSAFSANSAGVVTDESGLGFTSIHRKEIILLSPSAELFEDNSIAMMRVVRKAAKYHYTIPKEVKDTIREMAPNKLLSCPPEQLRTMCQKSLSDGRAEASCCLWMETGLIDILFPSKTRASLLQDPIEYMWLLKKIRNVDAGTEKSCLPMTFIMLLMSCYDVAEFLNQDLETFFKGLGGILNSYRLGYQQVEKWMQSFLLNLLRGKKEFILANQNALPLHSETKIIEEHFTDMLPQLPTKIVNNHFADNASFGLFSGAEVISDTEKKNSLRTFSPVP